jgi:hypothetical protein
LADLLAETGTPSADTGGTHVIERVVVSRVRVLPDGRVGVVVEWQGQNVGEANFEFYVWDGERWLLDDEISGFVWTEREEAEIGDYVPAERRAVSPGVAGAATPIPVMSEEVEPEEAELVAAEVDRVLYVEPTKAGAKFRIEAIIFGPIVGDEVGGDVTCSRFAFERVTGGTTVTAQCRAGEVMTGREAGLDVMAYGADFSAGNSCEDTTPLAAEMVFSCTVEDPVPPS